MPDAPLKLLLHVCCAPCSPHVIGLLQKEFTLSAFFYNPNIHPYQEFARRMATLEDYAAKTRLPIIWDRSYHLEEFLRLIVFREQDRCRFCYYLRLKATARVAKAGVRV